MDESKQIIERLSKVEEFIDSLKSVERIPYNVDSAFRERLNLTNKFAVSTKSADSEDITINEAGVSVTDVLNDPDGFLKVILESGVEKAVPYYDL